jgi:hypothetical protein
VASQIPASYFEREQSISNSIPDSNKEPIVYKPPKFDSNTNYYNLFWRSFLQNENILNEIQNVASENLQVLNSIYNLEDFYDNNLLPKMLSFPNQYIARIKNINQKKG